MRSIFAVCVFVFCFQANARIEVAFIEVRSASGQLVQLEKHGRYAHVAIRFHDQWLHADPYRGVELVDSLDQMGTVAVRLVSEVAPDLEAAEVERSLGLRYDRSFGWDDKSSTYCAKLIGELLKIAPTPMNFDADIWKIQSVVRRGELGLSPDDLYTALKERGYRSRARTCSALFGT